MSADQFTGVPVGVNDVLAAQGSAVAIVGACPWCSGPYSAVMHHGPCPRLKAIEYHPNGAVKRVEFHAGQMTGSDPS